MFSDAVRDGVCESNPFLGLRLRQSRGRKDLEIPSDEQFDQLVAAAKQIYPGWGERVFSHMIVLAAYTGLRPGELAGVRWDDVDFRRERLQVERQYNPATRSFAEPKFGSRRTIFLPPPAARAVRSTARVRDEVFSSPQGAILSRKLLAEYFKPVANSVGLTGWTPHCLRHAYGSRLARLGLDAFTIARSMGHRDNGRVAMERYIHWSERDAFNRTARAFGSSQREFRLLSGAEREQDAQESQS